MIVVIIYIMLGYWAYGYVNRNKVFFGRTGSLFAQKIAFAAILGWLYIPIALIQVIFRALVSK